MRMKPRLLPCLSCQKAPAGADGLEPVLACSGRADIAGAAGPLQPLTPVFHFNLLISSLQLLLLQKGLEAMETSV